ncbi:MAG: hypothetical protein IKW27_10220 [Bacteroidales bacterium]|nr:hypothetical protein [Bacteroidales bacterium]
MKKINPVPYEVLPALVQMAEYRLMRTFTVTWPVADEPVTNDLGIPVYQTLSIELTGEFGYGDIVSKIVAMKYSDSDVTAISLNYLNSEFVDSAKRSEYINEYLELQNWRQKAKDIAKAAIIFCQDNGWID